MKFKNIMLLTTVIFLQSCSFNDDKPQTADCCSARCTGKKNCTVCSNCTRCQHCHVNGGSCGVCK